MPGRKSRQRRRQKRRTQARNTGRMVPRGLGFSAAQQIRLQGRGVAMDIYSDGSTINGWVIRGGTSPISAVPLYMANIWTDSHIFNLSTLYNEWKLHAIRVEIVPALMLASARLVSSGSFVIGVEDEYPYMTVTAGAVSTMASSKEIRMLGFTGRSESLTHVCKSGWRACSRAGETTQAATRLCAPATVYGVWDGLISTGTYGHAVIHYDLSFRQPLYNAVVNGVPPLVGTSDLSFEKHPADWCTGSEKCIPLNSKDVSLGRPDGGGGGVAARVGGPVPVEETGLTTAGSVPIGRPRQLEAGVRSRDATPVGVRETGRLDRLMSSSRM